jgi:hypothetical protein
MSILTTKSLRRLSLGFPTLDEVFPGLEPGDFIVTHGNAAPSMSSTLSVRAQLPNDQGGLESPTIFIDGGNSFSPYEIAETARDYGLDCKATLEKVFVSRAFTAYQLTSLILEKAHTTLQKTRAKLLIVSDITSLFLDRDIPKLEGRQLFTKTCSKLSEIASEKQTIILANYSPRNWSRQSLFLEAILLGKSNILIRLEKHRQAASVSIEDHPHLQPFHIDFTPNEQPSHVYGGASFG